MKKPRVPLGDVAEFINGLAFKPEDWSEDGRPIVRIQNLTDSSKPFNRTRRSVDSKYEVSPGELLVSWSATLGVFQWPGPDTALVNQHIFRVVPAPKRITRDYLRHMLIDALVRMEGHLHGATMKHVNRKEFLATEIPLPPLPVQKRIAAILDAADALRAKRRESIEQLDSLIQSTFLEMFGDPVTNPKGWEVYSVGACLEQGLLNGIQDGNHGERHPKVADFESVGIPFVMANCLSDGVLDLGRAYRLNPDWLDRLRVGFSKPGDVLLSHKGTVGETAIVPDSESNIILSPQVTYYRPSSRLRATFLARVFACSTFQHLLQKEAKQSTRAYIGVTKQKRLPLITPPLDLQTRFASIVESIEQQKARLKAHLAELDTLFASLQSRAFNGELVA